MRKGTLEIVSDKLRDGSRMATLNLSISDATGDNAILEYIGGKLVIHHNKAYQVMTNSPVFEKQLALNEYWQSIGGLVFPPGTNRAAARFVRASSSITAIPPGEAIHTAIASVFRGLRNTSVPH